MILATGAAVTVLLDDDVPWPMTVHAALSRDGSSIDYWYGVAEDRIHPSYMLRPEEQGLRWDFGHDLETGLALVAARTLARSA